MRTLSPDNPALKSGRSIFWAKQVKAPEDVKNMLQPASMNAKLGAGKTTITKGAWKGMPLYQLTLEERKTCPKTCQQWANCYGNNMPFGNRIDHEDDKFYTTLSGEIAKLDSKHPSGFVIRLHVLGDFYSVRYVNFWGKKLKEFPTLRIFGYTHRAKTSSIGKKIHALNASDRFWVRWSDAGGEMSANVDKLDGTLGEGIHCPQQSGRTASCLSCGMCWTKVKAIRFSAH